MDFETSRRLFRHDPDVGYTFIPNLKVRVPHESGGYLVATNSLGFRSGEPGGEGRRVLVFGDSFTAGDGVSNPKRWTDLLAGQLNGVEVLNFGLPGTGTDQHYIAWGKYARDLRADLLVVAVLVENVRRITSAYRPVETPEGVQFRAKPYFELADGRLERRHDPVPEALVPAAALEGATDTGGRYPWLRRMVNRMGLRDLVQSMTAYQPVPDYDDPGSPGWQLMRAILTAWHAEVCCPMVIVPLPLYQHVEETADAGAYQQRFAELGADLGVTILDPLPALRAHDRTARRGFRFAKDVHLSPAGHAALAAALAPGIATALDAPR